ncbi:uncharacterized protein [Fopius arisanus]|uniref:TIGD6_2 protein n=1 Tax=Fopius arisanus TaxID=64838 RepID=A0A0C9R9L5_9HYME|nr:PREDICTED: uncharacterized protein LOC105265893 [Fopius arisanus]XP_011301989.1 PREDICTED: uncharacterized protein LOC105265893 [Fopius arisanus]
MPRVMTDPSKKRKRYPRQKLLDALEAVKCGRSLREVSIEYGVPKTTLMSKFKGTHPIDGKSGPPPVLDEAEEMELVRWVNDISEVGFALKKNQMCASVQTSLKELKRKNIFSNDKPGHNWYKNFEERHAEIVDRFKKNLSYAKTAPSEASVRQWFAHMRKYLETNALFNIDPSRIFTTEEAAFIFNPTGKKIIVRKGDRADFSFTHNHVDECATSLFTANATGSLAPPMIVFKQDRIRPGMLSKLPENWTIGKTTDGWMTKEGFHEYLTKVFDKWLKTNEIEKPVVIFLDSNTVFMTHSLSKFCMTNKIHLLPLHPNMGHILQPLDFQFFGDLKEAWLIATEHWRMNNNRKRIKKENFVPLLVNSLRMVDVGKVIPEGFKSCGIQPFSPDAVNYGRKGRFKMQVIVKSKESEDLDDLGRIIDPQYSADEVRKHLEFLEDFVDDQKLRKFKEDENAEAWRGDIKDTTLFLLWKKLRRMSSCVVSDCEIYMSTMEPGASRGHFMSIDDGNYQGSSLVIQDVQGNYDMGSMRAWMGNNLEKLE